jgi:hypothetical protein
LSDKTFSKLDEVRTTDEPEIACSDAATSLLPVREPFALLLEGLEAAVNAIASVRAFDVQEMRDLTQDRAPRLGMGRRHATCVPPCGVIVTMPDRATKLDDLSIRPHEQRANIESDRRSNVGSG